MFSCEICEIFKNIYFEENLRKTAFICFSSKYYSKQQWRVWTRQDLDRVQSKYFFKRNSFIRSNAAISFIYKLKNVSLTFQLTFLLNVSLCALFEFYFTPVRLGRYDVSQTRLAQSENSSYCKIPFSFPVTYQQIYCSIQTFKLVNYSLTSHFRAPGSHLKGPRSHLIILGSQVLGPT